jgi:hypothetical protein
MRFAANYGWQMVSRILRIGWVCAAVVFPVASFGQIAPIPAGVTPAFVHRDLAVASGDSGDHHTRTNVLVLLGAGAGSFGVLWLLPESISKWDKTRPMGEYLRIAYGYPPVWDKDHWFWNYITHPIFGQWTYLMERNLDESPLRGFLFSTAASLGWEYGFEALIERPSIQDLLFTSTIGSVLGEGSFKLTQHMRIDGFSFWEKIALVVVNPVYVVQKRGFK